MRINHLFVLSLLAVIPSCLDDASPTPAPGAQRAFGVVPEDVVADRVGAPSVAPWTALVPGSHCAAHADCDSALGAGDGYCYRGDVGGSLVFPDDGYCTIDDGTGTVCAVDGDCPGDSRCADLGGYRLCMPACGDGDSCPSGQACITSFDGIQLGTSVCFPGSSTAQDGDACTGFYDCGPSSTCWRDMENPGGYCSAYSCTPGTNAGCNGGVCIAFTDGPSTGNVCMDACSTNSDCREAEGYVCHDPDGDGGAAAYCRRPHVGDACASNEDCGPDWTCNTGEGWSGGYCTVNNCAVPGTTEGCGSGAICATVDGANMCVDRCAAVGQQSRCRDGYVCQAVTGANGGACLAQ